MLLFIRNKEIVSINTQDMTTLVTLMEKGFRLLLELKDDEIVIGNSFQAKDIEQVLNEKTTVQKTTNVFHSIKREIKNEFELD